jgi:hypothetical protein
MATFAAIGGVPREILYDRMKTAVIGETAGGIVYNRALIDFARHDGCPRPHRDRSGSTFDQFSLACLPDHIHFARESGPRRGSRALLCALAFCPARAFLQGKQQGNIAFTVASMARHYASHFE